MKQIESSLTRSVKKIQTAVLFGLCDTDSHDFSINKYVWHVIIKLDGHGMIANKETIHKRSKDKDF